MVLSRSDISRVPPQTSRHLYQILDRLSQSIYIRAPPACSIAGAKSWGHSIFGAVDPGTNLRDEEVRPHSPFGDRGPALLLWCLQSPINIGMILRVAESFCFEVLLRDAHGVMDDTRKCETISDFACGALARRGVTHLGDDALAQLRGRGRLIATDIEGTTASLPDYRYRPGDVFILGNEYSGLPAEITAAADEVLSIPMPAGWTPKPDALRPIDALRTSSVARNGMPSLNVAMTAGIVCYSVYTKAPAAQTTA